MLTVDEALDTILSNVQTADAGAAPLQECLNRVLAEDLTTPHDSPPFDKSMMDGFAVNSAGFTDASTRTLPIREMITAGTVPSAVVEQNSSSRIMTGAPIPAGADCVVPVELVEFDPTKPDIVTVSADTVSPGKNVLRQGTSARQGTPLMVKGTLLQPQHIAVLAEFGVATVPVYPRPTMAVLATGDELLNIDQPLTPGRIRNSNEPMLVSQIQRAGGIPKALGVAKDNRDDLRAHISEGLSYDFLLLSGGVSAGTLDLVPSELAAAGVEQVFHKIQMKPGKPLWFGRLKSDDHNCLVFGLPGNPVSSMICFELFVRTAFRKLVGLADSRPAVLSTTLQQEVQVRGDRVTYFPTRLQITKAGVTSTPVPWGGSADLRATAEANGMSVFPPRSESYVTGETVDSIWW